MLAHSLRRFVTRRSVSFRGLGMMLAALHPLCRHFSLMQLIRRGSATVAHELADHCMKCELREAGLQPHNEQWRDS